jgi:hypothetical protein
MRAQPQKKPATIRDVLPASYPRVLQDLKSRIRASQTKAAVTVNRQLIGLYLHIGHVLSEPAVAEAKWGDGVMERLATSAPPHAVLVDPRTAKTVSIRSSTERLGARTSHFNHGRRLEPLANRVMDRLR